MDFYLLAGFAFFLHHLDNFRHVNLMFKSKPSTRILDAWEQFFKLNTEVGLQEDGKQVVECEIFIKQVLTTVRELFFDLVETELIEVESQYNVDE